MARGITILLVVTAAMAVGFVMGRFTAPGVIVEPDQKVYPRAELDRFEIDRSRAQEDLAQMRTERDRAAEERDAAVARLTDITCELDASRARAAELELAASGLRDDQVSPIPLVFGKWGEVDGVRNANWDEMSEAVENINALIKDAIDRDRAGNPIPPRELQQSVTPWNAKLVRYLGSVTGSLPTHATVNGEYTHPITLANLMVQMLERVGLPISDQQYDAIAGLGDEYDREYDRLQKSYDDSTLQVDRVVDALALKADIMFNMESVLTAAQRGAIIVPEIHNRAFLDSRSPVLMVILTTKPVPVASAQAIRDLAPVGFAKYFGVAPETLDDHSALFDSWYKEVSSIFEKPVEAKNSPFYTLEQALISGRAHSHVVNTLLANLDLPQETVQRILADGAWSVPQVLVNSGGDDSDP